MSSEGLSRDAALRIGLSVRTLPDTDAARLVAVLTDAAGLPFTTDKLDGVTVEQLRGAAGGELSGLDEADLEQAVRCLWGDADAGIAGVPEPRPLAAGEMPRSIRVAVASNSGEALDGHFGSCARFLVYQVDAEQSRLVDVRPSGGPGRRDGKNSYRAGLIEDCHVVCVQSIGGPAAAKVVRAGGYPMKFPRGGEAAEVLGRLQAVLNGTPPPWLARVVERSGAGLEA